jgi:hypothetical protein
MIVIVREVLTHIQARDMNAVIETAEAHGVRCYIFIPCVVDGEGEGFGNRISIQTVAVVKAAKKVGTVYDVNSEGAVSIPSSCSCTLCTKW